MVRGEGVIPFYGIGVSVSYHMWDLCGCVWARGRNGETGYTRY